MLARASVLFKDKTGGAFAALRLYEGGTSSAGRTGGTAAPEKQMSRY